MATLNEVLIGAFKNLTGWGKTGDAPHVRPFPGPQTVGHNRMLLDVDQPADPTSTANVDTAMESATWTDAENITEVTVTTHPTAGTTLANGVDGIWIVFDVANDSIAAEWLAEAEKTSTDSHRYYVFHGQPRTFRFTSNISNAYAITANDGASATDITSHISLEAN